MTTTAIFDRNVFLLFLTPVTMTNTMLYGAITTCLQQRWYMTKACQRVVKTMTRANAITDGVYVNGAVRNGRRDHLSRLCVDIALNINS